MGLYNSSGIESIQNWPVSCSITTTKYYQNWDISHKTLQISHSKNEFSKSKLAKCFKKSKEYQLRRTSN